MWAGKLGSLALQLLSGAAVTAEIFLGAAPVLLLLAVLAGAARLSPWRPLRWLALGYIAFLSLSAQSEAISAVFEHGI